MSSDCPVELSKVHNSTTLTAWHELLIKVFEKNFDDEYLDKTKQRAF